MRAVTFLSFLYFLSPERNSYTDPMITTDQLKTVLFCPRKLFLESVLHFPQERSKAALKQTILHEALRYTNRAEPGVVKTVNEPIAEKHLAERYHASNHRSLQEAILKHKPAISKEGLSLIDLHKDLWTDLKKATQARIHNTYTYMTKHQVYGQDLWRLLEPKITFSLAVATDKLQTTVYRLDNYEHDARPFIITKQTPPEKGLWPSQKYHLASIMLALAQQGLIVQEGVALYDEGKIPRTILMTPDLEQETNERLAYTQTVITSQQLPGRVTNTKKCDRCPYRSHCYDDAYMAAKLQELSSGSIHP